MAETSESSVFEKSGNGTSEEKGEAQAKAEELKERVVTRVDSATTRVGKRIESVSHAMRERASHASDEGRERVQGAASAVADRLDRLGTYLQEKDVGGMTQDLGAMIRRHPVRSLFVGMGLGYLIARLTSRR